MQLNGRDAYEGLSVRVDDPAFALEVACQNERKNWVASRIGLPTIGSALVNQHGIEWVVQNHAAVPTCDTLQRWRSGDIDPRDDLYPVVTPRNLSPKLMEFICAVDRCTTKTFAILDTMPGRRKDGHVPGGNSIDTLCHPATNLLFIDAARVNETVLAHEFGHAWVQYVDVCEDLRTLQDASDPQRLRQVGFVQSFVLDLKVNDLLRGKGFDLSPIEADQGRSLEQLAAALQGGYRPDHPREEVFMALLVADELIQRDLEFGRSLVRFDDSVAAIQRSLLPMVVLADRLADGVRNHGYASRDGIIACIDKCLLAAFEYCGDSIDLDSELVVVSPEEPNIDKFPRWLPQLRPQTKCIVGKHMARNDVSSDWSQSIAASLTGRARMVFTSPTLERSSDVLLPETIGPPTRYCNMPEAMAEQLAMKTFNRTGSYQVYGGPPHSVQDSFATPEERPIAGRASAPADFPNCKTFAGPAGIQSSPRLPGRPYMAGLGRFLTAVRADEWAAGEHPYGYALNNPVTYTDPSGLKTCEQILDECLQAATNKWDLCRRKAQARFDFDRNVCSPMTGIARDECLAAAGAKLLAALAACGTKHNFRFELCGAQFEECKHGRDIARGVLCWTIAAGTVYCIYRGCKIVGGLLATPETGPGGIIIAISP